MKRLVFLTAMFVVVLGVLAAPVFAQGGEEGAVAALTTKALAMAIAAAGCGYAQSKALAGGCMGVARNPGAADTIRFFIILGLAFIEFLALLVFLYVAFLG